MNKLMTLLKTVGHCVKCLTAISILIITSCIIPGCDKEEDDFISQPTETSTIITGYIKTPDGTPLADIPVSVDFKAVGILATSVTHKAKGVTDKSGFYKIFFEANENEQLGISSGYTFSVDFSVLSSDKYIISERIDYGFVPFSDNWSGSTLKSDFTVPLKKLVKVTIKNNGLSIENGKYAVKNMFSYIEYDDVMHDDSNLWDEYGKWRILESIDIPQSGSTSVMLPCAIGTENTIKVVYMGNETIQYGNGLPASDTKEIFVTDKFNDELEFDFITHNPDYR